MQGILFYSNPEFPCPSVSTRHILVSTILKHWINHSRAPFTDPKSATHSQVAFPIPLSKVSQYHTKASSALADSVESPEQKGCSTEVSDSQKNSNDTQSKPIDREMQITFEDGSQECSNSSSFHSSTLKEISQLQPKRQQLQVSGTCSSTYMTSLCRRKTGATRFRSD